MDIVFNFFSSLITFFLEYVMHFDRYIPIVMQEYGILVYVLLFLIFFCETGLVVTPFLPGDSLLFACGALSATAIGLNLPFLIVLCLIAAILGDACNYMIGEKFGHHLLSGNNRFIKAEHIQKAENFYEKHGHKAIFLARFVPIVRTFAPFVAGIGNMHYRTFATYNVIGAVCWVFLFIGAGYFFGNLPFVQNNFPLVSIGIIIFSLLPIIYEFIMSKK
ncbi:MAG TPA: DedA family protein [Candidatus Avacidaminococcus intestinavium]|uniref:DedA family protein n=1 Tax=Candidatus Avacidaminococcus intestinavium TaxID=2840684 RepID=A0A9D1MP89_9FIRM|nr:DedA family protein [Candidatus Avacidaminococcus intestinavium]